MNQDELDPRRRIAADHRVLRLEPTRPNVHRAPDGSRCFCHGHCADCGLAVMTDKVGRLLHYPDEYRAVNRRAAK